jgi:DNA repair protein RadC
MRFGQAVGRTIHAPSEIAGMLVDEMSTLEREELRVAILNTRNGILAVETVYQGNVSSSLVRIGELFCEAVRRQASSILLIHNHPSGDPTPSPDDLRLTAEALAAGRLLDIQLLDHVVIAGGSWVSLRDRGVAFDSPGDHRGGDVAWTLRS